MFCSQSYRNSVTFLLLILCVCLRISMRMMSAI
nr:MAG TPA: hypothetical protein [Caudoviricetes sp.]